MLPQNVIILYMYNDPKNIRLIVADIDDTMIPAGSLRISDRLREDLQKAESKGIHVMVNSGRHYTFMQPTLFEDLPMELIGTINGACLVARDGTVIESHQMSETAMNQITDLCIHHNIGLGFKFIDHVCTYANYEKFINGYCHTDSEKSIVINDDENRTHHLHNGYPLGVFIIGEESVIEPLKQSVPGMSFAWSSKDGYDIFQSDLNKASAVEPALKKYGLSWDQVIGFGDAGNDTPFIRKAGIGVAMGNSKDDVRAAADIIAPSSADDGVAAVLEQLKIV
ncbi:MAG: HAD family phosphatase [Erysipelotrichia bacterium]|nr:HAD family phosphatase [Erysipelotrichia bacterium]